MKKLYPILYTLAVIIITLCLVIPHYFPLKGPNPSESETIPPATVETLTAEEMFMKYHLEDIVYFESTTMEEAQRGIDAVLAYMEKLNALNTQAVYRHIICQELERMEPILLAFKNDYDRLKYIYKVVPDSYMDKDFKSYMDYRAITAINTPHYKLQKNYAYTGEDGVRMVNGRYCIALGSYFTIEIGQYIDVILENGTILHCILGDQKSDKHTDKNHIAHPDGSVMEFIIDENKILYYSKIMGNMIYSHEEWQSPVVAVKIYVNQNIFNE